VQYIRYRDFWVLLATSGYHRFFQEHSQPAAGGIATIRQYKDARETPILFGGYSLGHNGKASVRISRPAYRELKGHFLTLATAHRPTERLEREFHRSPFEAYGGVTRQMFAVLRAVNKARKTAGLDGQSLDPSHKPTSLSAPHSLRSNKLPRQQSLVPGAASHGKLD